MPYVSNPRKPVKSYTLTMNTGVPYADSSVDIATLDLWEDSRITLRLKPSLTIFGYPLQLKLSENQ